MTINLFKSRIIDRLLALSALDTRRGEAGLLTPETRSALSELIEIAASETALALWPTINAVAFDKNDIITLEVHDTDAFITVAFSSVETAVTMLAAARLAPDGSKAADHYLQLHHSSITTLRRLLAPAIGPAIRRSSW